MKKINLFWAIVLTFLAGCTLDLPKDPRPPKWDVQIDKIPLFKADTLRLGDQLKPDDFNRLVPDSVLSIDIEREESFNLGDRLKIKARKTSFKSELGIFEISAEQSSESKFRFAEIFPQYAGLLGTTSVLAPTDIEPGIKNIILEDFETVSVIFGKVHYAVTNNLGFILSGDVRMAIIDEGAGGVPIDTLFLRTMEVGETQDYYSDLAGKKITSQIKTVIFGRADGSEGVAVTIPENSSVDVTISPESIFVDEANARLKEQHLNLSGVVDLSSDSITVKNAKIESGSIEIKMRNEFAFEIEVEIQLAGVTLDNNEVAKLTYHLGIGETKSDEINLDNCDLALAGGELAFDVSMIIYPQSDVLYWLKSDDYLLVDVDLSNIQISEVTGDLFLTTDLPEIKEEVFCARPERLQNFDFHEVLLQFEFLRTTQFDLGLDLEITGLRSDTSYTLHIKENVGFGAPLILSRDGVNGDLSTPTIVDLINTIPEYIIIKGKARVIGDDVTIRKNDLIGVNVTVDFPLIFSTNNSSFSKIDSLKMSDDIRKNLKENNLSGGIHVSIENALPISGTLILQVGKNDTEVSNEIFNISLPKSMMTSEGIVVEAGEGTFDIELENAKVFAIGEAKFYKFHVILDNIEEATLTANDFIIVRDVFISQSFLFDPDNLANEESNGN